MASTFAPPRPLDSTWYPRFLSGSAVFNMVAAGKINAHSAMSLNVVLFVTDLLLASSRKQILSDCVPDGALGPLCSSNKRRFPLLCQSLSIRKWRASGLRGKDGHFRRLVAGIKTWLMQEGVALPKSITPEGQ